MINRPPGPDFLDRKIHFTIVYFERERHCHFAKARVSGFDPFLESFGCESPHVPQHDGMDELADYLALPLGC